MISDSVHIGNNIEGSTLVTLDLNFKPVLISDWIHYSSDWNTLFHYQYFVYSNNINYLQCRNLNKLLNQF